MFINPAAELLVPPLGFIIDNLKNKYFPDAWKTARISAIPEISQST